MITTLDEFEAEYGETIGQELAFKRSREPNLDNIRCYCDGAGHYATLVDLHSGNATICQLSRGLVNSCS